jgi:arylsulfatase A-like enzyme
MLTSFPFCLRYALLAIVTLLSWLCSSQLNAAEPTKKPNVLILMTDDWRPDVLGVLGHPLIQTPNLDALAKRGTILHNMYCLGSNSGAVCRPSRNMFLSGKAYFRWQGPDAPGNEQNLPVTFKSAGYETWHLGKRGNTAVPIQTHFEHNNYLQEDKDRRSGEPGHTLTEAALKFLNERDKQRPFLMYCAYEGPHDPCVPNPADRKLYDPAKIPLPKNFLPQHPFNNGEMAIRDEKLLPWPRTETALREHLADYYGVITGLDREFGRLFARLAEQGELQNTVIVFTSDHGLALGGHGLMGKQNLYEHSMRPPCIIAGPTIPVGESRELFYLLDIFPTLCGLTGVTVPGGLDGQNFAKLIQGEKQSGRGQLMTAYRVGQRAVRDAKYKLIRYPHLNKSMLYDLESDPDELKDLSQDPAHAKTLKRLEENLRSLQGKLGDELPLSVEQPLPEKWSPPAGKMRNEK